MTKILFNPGAKLFDIKDIKVFYCAKKFKIMESLFHWLFFPFQDK
jgi:hypothetical protein